MQLFGGVIPITGITFLMFSIFSIIAVGFAVGRITVKGVSLGDAGVFIIALVFGCLFFDALGHSGGHDHIAGVDGHLHNS